MESDLISKAIFGGGAETGGYQDDYRNRVNWSTSGENRYFYKYTDMAQTGKIQNTMIPMLRLGEMYLIAAESQSDVLANGTSYVNTLRRNRGHQHLARGPDARTAQVRVHPRTVRRRSAVLPLQTPLLEGDLVLYRLPEPRTEHEPFRRAAARFGDRKPRITP